MTAFQSTPAFSSRRLGRFGVWSDPAFAVGLVVLWVALAFFFNRLPQIDKAVSSLFFAATNCATGDATRICGEFPAAYMNGYKLLRSAFMALPIVAALVVAAILSRDLVAGRRWHHERVRASAVALAALAVGPGLLVNAFLKEYIGRARPQSTSLFGGEQPFVAAAEWSDACQHNCSFVSGEAAAIAWLACLLPLCSRQVRRVLILPMGLIIVTAGMLRVAFGRHFLSDVVLGSLSTLVVFCLLAWASEYLARGSRVLAPR